MQRTFVPGALTLGSLALAAGLGAPLVAGQEPRAVAAAGPAAPDDPKVEVVKATPPPGLVEIAGGRTTVGSTEKEIVELLTQDQWSGYVRVLDAQTPQQSVEVATFWIGKYEVTKAEYLAFVEATGYQPPLDWANPEAMAKAAADFAKAENEKFEAAKAEGRKYEKRAWAAGEGLTPRDSWWTENWREAGYAIPKDEERFPVVMVSYADAQAYCDWAGLRLPTEFEFTRAARKEGKSPFPWGDQWEDGKFCLSREMRRSKPYPVGSFEAGVSPFGVHDLAGNVWEWTSSPYVPFKGFKQGKYTVRIGGKKEEKSTLPLWDPNQRVVVGGSFENDQLAARIATRRATDRSQNTGGTGFRVAATPGVGVDKATSLVENVVRNSPGRADGVTYEAAGTVGLDRWHVGAAGITGYDYMLFVPVGEVEEGVDSELKAASQVAPKHLGFLASNLDMLEPELPAGGYFVAYRAAGKPRAAAGDKAKDDKAKKPEGEEQDPAAQEAEPTADPVLDGLDLGEDWLIFVRATDGTRAAAIKSPAGLSWEKGNAGGSFKVVTENVRVGSGANATMDPRTYVDVEVNLIGKIRNRALPVKFRLRPSAGATGAPWRQ